MGREWVSVRTSSEQAVYDCRLQRYLDRHRIERYRSGASTSLQPVVSWGLPSQRLRLTNDERDELAQMRGDERGTDD